jgi:hypothetical protein
MQVFFSGFGKDGRKKEGLFFKRGSDARTAGDDAWGKKKQVGRKDERRAPNGGRSAAADHCSGLFSTK